MKKSLVLSLFVVHALNASGVDLGQINVEDSHKKETIKDVASEDIKSADLGEALMKNSASVNIVRRSAISNDIIVRGQKKTISMSPSMELRCVGRVPIEWIPLFRIF